MKTTHFLTCFAILSTLWICSCSSDPEIIEPEGPPAPFINQQDMEALRAIYKEGGGEYWDVPWDLSDSTKWAGVSARLVNPETNEYRIYWLHIVCNKNYQVGVLSKEIEKLTELQILYIDGEGIGGELPSTLSNLKELRELSFINTSFRGKIPEGIVSLPNMRFFKLINCNLSGELPKDITETAPSLLQMDLSLNNLSGKIPSGLKARYLNLEYNNFTEYPYEYLPANKEIEYEGPAVS